MRLPCIPSAQERSGAYRVRMLSRDAQTRWRLFRPAIVEGAGTRGDRLGSRQQRNFTAT
jgi:hypothetical protein